MSLLGGRVVRERKTREEVKDILVLALPNRLTAARAEARMSQTYIWYRFGAISPTYRGR
jgi:hypothetical protein